MSATATRSATATQTTTGTRSATTTRTPTRTGTATATPTQSATITPTVPTVGPTITYLGVARADGHVTQPADSLPDGTPVFLRPLGQGFLLVIEAKPGPTNRPVGLATVGALGAVPDLQVVVSRALGDGSLAVCDAGPQQPIGGVPAVDPPQFGGAPANVNALNDLGCRFVAITSPNDGGTTRGPCTRNAGGEGTFVKPTTRVQFCSQPGIGAELAFPLGDTRVTARALDVLGQPGTPASIIVRVVPPSP